MGEKRIRKISIALALAAVLIFCSSLGVARLSAWLSTKRIDELYGLLHWALVAVTVGVIAEEWEIFPYVKKFVVLVWNGEWRHGIHKVLKHRGKVTECVGFFVLTMGLTSELIIGRLVEAKQGVELSGAVNNAAIANQQTKDLGEFVTDLERAVTPRSNDLEIGGPIRNLKKFAGTTAYFVVSDNAESQAFAATLTEVLANAGWFVMPPTQDKMVVGFPDVFILYANANVQKGANNKHLGDAANAFCRELRNQGLKAFTGDVQSLVQKGELQKYIPFPVALNSIVIHVGSNSMATWFFLDQILKRQHSPRINLRYVQQQDSEAFLLHGMTKEGSQCEPPLTR